MKIFGTIKDTSDKPIEGVHVRMKLFNNIGEFTDKNGAFVKDSPAIKETDEILITHVAYEPITVLAKDLVGKKITMTEATNELNEVVVTTSNGFQDSLVGNANSSMSSGTTTFSQPITNSTTKVVLAVAGGLALMTVGFILIKKNI